MPNSRVRRAVALTAGVLALCPAVATAHEIEGQYIVVMKDGATGVVRGLDAVTPNRLLYSRYSCPASPWLGGWYGRGRHRPLGRGSRADG